MAIIFVGPWAATSSQLDHAETVAFIYTAEDSIAFTLSSEVGDAEFAYSPRLASGVFVDQGLATPQRDRVYQLWLVDDSRESTVTLARTLLPAAWKPSPPSGR